MYVFSAKPLALVPYRNKNLGIKVWSIVSKRRVKGGVYL